MADVQLRHCVACSRCRAVNTPEAAAAAAADVPQVNFCETSVVFHFDAVLAIPHITVVAGAGVRSASIKRRRLWLSVVLLSLRQSREKQNRYHL